MMKPVQSLNALFYMRLGHTWVRTFKFALKKGTKLQAGPAPQPTAAPLLTKSPAGFTRDFVRVPVGSHLSCRGMSSKRCTAKLG